MIDEVSLTLQQMLQAMDRGLIDEIKKQKQDVYHTAINGHLIYENNRRYIYEFTLEMAWDFEDDTAVVVKFGGTVDQDIKATIVTSTGVTIKIATEKPLPSDALQKIRLVDDSTQLLERLREALKSNDEGAALLGSKSFGLLPYTNNDWLPPVAFGSKFIPDDSQHRAITMALGSEVTYIIGPPGTGKTSTLAAIAFTHLCMGHSVLIVAHTNIAIDNAIMRLVDICQDSRNSTALQAFEAGRIIRYGIPQLEERIKDEYSNVHLPTIVARDSQSLNQQWEDLHAQMSQLTKQREQMEQEIAQAVQGSQRERQQLIAQRETDTNRLIVLQKQEQARKADFQRRYHDLSSQHKHAQQQVDVLAQQQAHISNQQIQQKTIITNCTSRIDEIETSLASAQQMNKLQRFFKRISTQDLARQHADNQQQRWSGEQALIILQKQMAELFALRATTEKQAEYLTLAISTLQVQYNEANIEAQTIVHLHATIHELEQDIARIDSESASARKSVEASRSESTRQQEGLQKQIELVEAQLVDIEKKIVAAAQVIATTLAKSYMNSNISERRFDVVIMDEVSMASLPAVYVAASHANQSIVIIGDPQQLSPIFHAETKVAEEWLGRDLFTMRGITLSSNNAHDSIMLNEQGRMHPHIANIICQHVYKGRLNHSPRVMNKEVFQRYATVQPLPGKPVLLCDTGDASPLATAPGGKSRINAYHALCSIELARQALSTLPERPVKKGEFRIGLITPYRKQAQLLQQLVKDAGLTDVVRAGTVHRFQGLEAEVIIFDTVESPSLPPSSFLTAGSWGSAAMRLTNVAMTRAKHKLIIVANYQYLQQKLGKHDTLRLAIQDAYAAGNIQSSKFLHFASQHNVSQPSESTIRANTNTSSLDNHIYEPEFLNETTFFPRLEQDISLAKKQIVIFSPYVERDRTEKLISLLAEKTKAGITITVICKSSETSPSHLKAKELLRHAGVQIRQPDDMKHEKFVFIDDEIAYTGGLNSLSQIKSTEFMERVKSPGYVRQLKKFMRVDDVVKAPTIWGSPITVSHDELPMTSKTVCKCGRVLIRRKNSKTQLPFYGCPDFFRNPDVDHSRENVSEYHLKLIPRLEEVKCGKCGRSTSIQGGFKEIQIVCAEAFICGYRQSIKFVSDGSV